MIIAKIVGLVWMFMLSLYLGFCWGYDIGRRDGENEKENE